MSTSIRWLATLGLAAGLICSVACGDDTDGLDDAGTVADAGVTPADAGETPTDAGETPADAGMGGSAEARAYCEGIQPTQQALAAKFGPCEDLIALISLENEADLVACSVVVDGCMADTLTWYETFNDTIATCIDSAPECPANGSMQWARDNLDNCAQQAILAAGSPPWGNDPDCGLAP